MPAVMQKVLSSFVISIGYDDAAQELHVRYAPTVKNPAGDLVVYGQVEPETANDIMSAPSIGQALHSDIRGKYPHKKL